MSIHKFRSNFASYCTITFDEYFTRKSKNFFLEIKAGDLTEEDTLALDTKFYILAAPRCVTKIMKNWKTSKVKLTTFNDECERSAN